MGMLEVAGPRDWAGRGLLAVAAVGALVAFVGSLGEVGSATHATLVLVTWRLVGFGFFAAAFAVLAIRPRRSAGLWELAILNKVALAIFGLAFGPSVDGAPNLVIFDGGLALVLAGAYLLCRGWTAWSVTAGRGTARDSRAIPATIADRE